VTSSGHDVDLGHELELDSEGVGEDRGCGREVSGTVAGDPEICRHFLDEAADLLAPAAVEGEEDADEEHGKGDASDRNREARPLGEQVLPGDQ
jgi:hypothetical protein